MAGRNVEQTNDLYILAQTVFKLPLPFKKHQPKTMTKQSEERSSAPSKSRHRHVECCSNENRTDPVTPPSTPVLSVRHSYSN